MARLVVYDLLLIVTTYRGSARPTGFTPGLTANRTAGVCQAKTALSKDVRGTRKIIMGRCNILCSALRDVTRCARIGINASGRNGFDIRLRTLRPNGACCCYDCTGDKCDVTGKRAGDFAAMRDGAPIFDSLRISNASRGDFVMSASILSSKKNRVFLSNFY